MDSGLWWIVVVAVSVGGSATAAPRAQGQPHLVLIVADDLGWNDVSWHNPRVVMPHLDQLAREGVILEQSYVQPICTPTRSALLTGRYPFTLGRQHDVLWPTEPTGLTMNATLLPESLKKAGYSTHIVGKWHLGFCNWHYTPTKRGFDTFYGYYTGAEDYYHHVRRQVTREEVPNFVDPEPCLNATEFGYDFRYNTTPELSVDGKYSTYVFASYIEDLLSTRSPSDPMFLYLPFQSVHSPLQVPDNYTKPYFYIRDRERRIKLGMVTAMDEAVGRVVAALKSSGHYNNSVIVFTTDNGGPTVSAGNNWPLRGNKTTLWEGGTRGAAFVHSPLLEHKGTVSHKLIHVTDWYKTLVALAGGEAPLGSDGYDQWEALSGTAESPRRHMIYNIDNTTEFSAGIRFGDYKLLVGNPGPGEWTPPPEYFEDSDIEVDLSNSTANSTDFQSSDNATELIVDIVTESDIDASIHTVPSSTVNTSFDEATAGSTPQESVTAVNINRRVHPNHIFSEDSVDVSVVTNKPDKHEEGRLEMKEMKMIEEMKKASEDEGLGNYEIKMNEEEGLEKDERKKMNEEEILHEEKERQEQKLKKYRLTKNNLEALLDSQEIQLFNLLEDPEERTNVADRHPNIVIFLKGVLLQEMARYVEADIVPNDPHGNPKYWNNIWTPGWCKAK